MLTMVINYSKEKPEIFYECAKKFGVTWEQGVVITYGDTIFSKFGDKLTPDLKVHEETHVRQQLKIGKDIWWGNYFKDADFRWSQEKEAYRNQYKFIIENYNREQRRFFKNHILDSIMKIYKFNKSRDQIEKEICTG